MVPGRRKIMSRDAWELGAPPYGMPDLESVVEHARESYVPPRKRPYELLSVTIRNLPTEVWDIAFLMKEKYPNIKRLSFAQGCLIRTGLRVIEMSLQASSLSVEERLKAIVGNDLDVRTTYVGGRYVPVHVGMLMPNPVRVFCLEEGDLARLSDIAHTYGLPLGNVTTLAMIAGVAQSTSIAPKPFQERAHREIVRFRKIYHVDQQHIVNN